MRVALCHCPRKGPQCKLSLTSPLSVIQAVQRAFRGEGGADRGRNYAATLLATVKDISDAEKRSALLALLVAATFELLDRAAIVNAQVGPFQIKDLSVIQKALPVVFAYLVYDLVVLGLRFMYSRAVYLGITRLFDPSLSSTKLDRLLLPHASSLFGPLFIGCGRQARCHCSRLYPSASVGIYRFPLHYRSLCNLSPF
jgi:hypothetical protein